MQDGLVYRGPENEKKKKMDNPYPYIYGVYASPQLILHFFFLYRGFFLLTSSNFQENKSEMLMKNIWLPFLYSSNSFNFYIQVYFG